MPKVCMASKTKGQITVANSVSRSSQEVILSERTSCTCFGFLFISSASATITARDRTTRVAFDAFLGFATVSANPLIVLVHFVLLRHISFYIYRPNSRLVKEA